MYQGCNSRGVFSKNSNFPLSTTWKWTSTDLEVLVHFHIVERGKLESLESLENIPNFSNFFRGLKRPLGTVPVSCLDTVPVVCLVTVPVSCVDTAPVVCLVTVPVSCVDTAPVVL